MNSSTPYLSIVATTRNDDHGGDLLQRTIAFLNSVYHQAARVAVPVELIIVEWNPPEDRPLLKELLPTPPADSCVQLRIIVVPTEIHDTYKFGDAIPLYQMIAKNVGIRRAKGEFILCTNIDILFSNDSFSWIAKRELEEGVFYRANRCDVPKEVMNIPDIEGQLSFSEKNIMRRLGKNLGRESLFSPVFLFHLGFVATMLNTIKMKLWRLKNPAGFPLFTIDFMACGDFTLMSKQDWMKIDGYVELDMYSIHIDSMAIWSACAKGMKQSIFPLSACVYHIDHDNGWETGDIFKMIKFLENKPCLDYSLVEKAGLKMVEESTNWNMNKPDWGWANEKFQENTFTPVNSNIDG